MSRKLGMFNNVSLDGYFTDADSDMSFAKPQGHDDEHLEFMRQNARDNSVLVFGRITYEMMASFWPTDMAKQMMPEVAKTMNASPKIVFSRTLKTPDWAGTTLLSGDPATEIARLKKESGPDMTVLGSGRIAAPLAQAGLFDEIGLMVIPVLLGKGRSLFEGVTGRPRLKLKEARPFQNGNVYLTYN
jgi:dihydrofolate reductase